MPTPAFEEAFEKVSKLAATFQANEARYLSHEYQEAEARNEFIDKLFIALGWDVHHDQQTNPYEQEVKVEPSVSAGGQRRADYSFHVAPNYRDVRFYVEAKKPHGDIATADNYFQTIRYAWNSETPLAVLTDFKQFHVLDCRYRPDIGTALHRHVAMYHYREYTDRQKFAEIYWLFSREAVADGSLEKRAKELPKPRGKAVQRGFFPGGYQSIDESFLNELDQYRKSLAYAFKKKNPKLNSETLTELAQRTLDRLVFLRFLEDKGIEPQRIVEGFGDKGTAWEDFVAASRRLDGIYNGIVFKHHDILDGDQFRVDDTSFGDICDSLAHVNSPYDFNYIPIHILGSIYERFLGNVIVATDKSVRVEPKPEVRKAGGVYYTPEYIVRYIVENTVGKLVAAKTPDQIAEMRFADIACGSGSFLLGVFDLLLAYHGQYYNAHPKKAGKGDCTNREGKLYLSLGKKREILLNNIYGVDIDAQAVEVCQLSLYLKLLQEETEASKEQYLLDFAHITRMRKLLPDLSKSIVCGNSLIGRDINGDLFGKERKLNAMDFEDAFPEIMKRGGFDAIVGNPPYVRIQHLKEWAPIAVDYYKERYNSAGSGNYDVYVVFVEKGLNLLQKGGKLGYILPHKFFNAQYGQPLRSLIAHGKYLSHIVHFGDLQIFEGATNYTCLMSLEKSGSESMEFVKVNDLEAWRSTGKAIEGTLPAASVTSSEWNFNVGNGAALFKKLNKMPVRLGLFADIFVGLQTSADDVFIMERIAETSKTLRLKSKALGREFTLEKGLLHPLVSGTDVNRYRRLPERQYVLFPYKVDEATVELIDFDKIRQSYPRTASYLLANRKRLENREKGKMKGARWYGYIYLKNMTRQSVRKLCVPRLVETLYAAYDSVGIHFLDNVDVGGITLKSAYAQQELPYLLGLLNSALLRWYFPLVSAPFRGGWFSANRQFLTQLPIRPINFSEPTDKARHDEMVAKVDAMLEAKKQLAKAKTDKDKTYYENKCAALDRQIDRLVYDLYGLTEEEVRIVEQNM